MNHQKQAWQDSPKLTISAHKTEEAKRIQTIHFLPSNSNGKEKDYESGFHYYGARYYWSELLTGWLSVDPMADKYPNISPYCYCAWNPVKLVDPDGEEAMDDWYKNDRTGLVGWHEGHAKQIVDNNGDTYTNIGESYSKPSGNGDYKNYYQNCLITQGKKQDASKLAYKNKAIRAKLLSNKSPLPTSHKKELFNSNVANRGMSTPDILGLQVSGNLFVGGGASVDIGIGYIKGDGVYGAIAISPGSGFDISGSVGVCIGNYNGSGCPSKENYAGLSYNVSAGAGSVFYQHSTSDLKGNGWNVSTFGVSAGTEIFFGGSVGVSHTKVW